MQPPVAQILSYWTRCLRQQESLAARPKARRPGTETEGTADLVSPLAGQEYMKLPFADCAPFLAKRDATLNLTLNAEGRVFFEHWLSEAYRSDSSNPEQLQYALLAPSVLLPKGELDSILRVEVQLRFLDERGKALSIPSAHQRRKGVFPEAPHSLQLRHRAPSGDEEERPWFGLNGRTLKHLCQVPEDEVDALLATLASSVPAENQTPADLLPPLLKLLAAQPQGDTLPRLSHDEGKSAVGQLEQLTRAVSSRLASTSNQARAFPVALLVCSSVSRATWHVQRDLELVRQSVLDKSPLNEPLRLYLAEPSLVAGTTGNATGMPEAGFALGRFSASGLTPSQVNTLESSLTRTLCAVQGPPGTGKTTLILNAVAHTLVSNLTPLLRNAPISAHTLLVTSTNNRAVDTVLNPLRQTSALHPLPLGLRVGSRQVMEKVAAVELERCANFLKSCPEPAAQHYDHALQKFSEQLEPFADTVNHLERERVRERTLQERESELIELALEEQGPELADETLYSLLDGKLEALSNLRNVKTDSVVRVARAAANELEQMADELDELDPAEPAGPAHKRLKRRIQTLQTTRIPELQELLGVSLNLALHKFKAASDSITAPDSAAPTDAAESDTALERLQTAVAEDAQRLQSLANHLKSTSTARKHTRRLRKLRREIDALRQAAAPPAAPPRGENQLYELFLAALELHHAWTLRHRDACVKALSAAANHARKACSLRRLLDEEGENSQWLRQLFPAWGCTLLSLGNNFPPTASIDRVVIDEAGQCHPAYAVSALLRARSALIVGDTHQLEPVFDLPLNDEERIAQSTGLKTPGAAPFRVFEGATSSAQSLAERAVPPALSLTDHFRSRLEIAEISNRLCNYGLTVLTPKRASGHAALATPVVFDAVLGEQVQHLGSWANREEAARVVDWLKDLLSAGVPAREIAVITPYRGQLSLLSQHLRAAGLNYEQEHSHEDDWVESGAGGTRIGVGTVHRFQGGERSVVLFSSVVTRTTHLRFLNERVNLVNVAVSRAKDCFITLGHPEALSAGAVTRHLLRT